MENIIVKNNFSYMWTGLSCFAFFQINKYISKYTPQQNQLDKYHQWKWRNIASSCIHSTITGVWTTVCLLRMPYKGREILKFYTRSAHQLISLSTGYFIYDLFDILFNDKETNVLGLILHHVLVIICFGTVISQEYYLGFALFSLLVELNSIFLHIRDLLLMHKFEKSHSIYKLNNFINLVTFVLFRFITLSWMIYFLCMYYDEFSYNVLFIAIISLPIILIMSALLFYKIIHSDYVMKT